ncbi:MAG: glycosyltransferase [Planctomycetota bacterium]|nr:glycosyltransferase [Planctomycetota bacterium]
MVATRLAAAQAALGHQTRILSYQFQGADDNIRTSLSTIPDLDKVDLQYLPTFTRAEHLLARNAHKLSAVWVAQADLVHLHGVWDPIIYAVSSVARKKGVPFVLTPHGMLDPWAISQKGWKKRLALAMGYRGMLNRAAFLHFLNKDEFALTTPLRLGSRPEIIPNGIFLEELSPLPEKGKFRALRPRLGDKPFVLFLSRLHYKKGLDYLADAFAIVARQFPDTRLVVAGPDDGARAPFESQIRQLGIDHQVDLVGPLYGPEKLQALVDCNCFCLPSRQEGFSLAITEAMACEAPVVISRSCHFPQVAEFGAGIITELNADEIAGAIGRILAAPAAARLMGCAGRELVVARYTWPIVARQMLDAYDRALGKSWS